MPSDLATAPITSLEVGASLVGGKAAPVKLGLTTTRALKKCIKRGLNLCGLDYERLSNGSGQDLTVIWRSGGEVQFRWMRSSPLGTLGGLRGVSIRTVLDIGAHHGQFARLAINAFPEAQIFSFEPLPGAFAELRRWAAVAPVRRVRPLNIALGEREAELELFEHLDATDTSSFLQVSEAFGQSSQCLRRRRTVKIKVESLDDFIAKAGLPLEPGILIKIDVQGYEDRVLKGATRTLCEAKACILEVLFDLQYLGQPSFEILSSQLRTFGYRYAGNIYQAYAQDGHVSEADALFVR